MKKFFNKVQNKANELATVRNMPLQSCLCAGLVVALFAELPKVLKVRLLTIGDV